MNLPGTLVLDQPEEAPRFDLSTCRRPFVTACELADYLHCDRRTIVRMIHEGSLPDSTKVGRNWRIPTDVARETFHVKQKQAS